MKGMAVAFKNRYSWRRKIQLAKQQLLNRKEFEDVQLDVIGSGHVWFTCKKNGDFGFTKIFRVKYTFETEIFEYFDKYGRPAS